VADAKAKNDSFISMVLDINGRVRPADLHGVPEPERETSIAAFFERHAGEIELHFDGDALVKGPAPLAVAAAQPPAGLPDEPAAPNQPAGPDAPVVEHHLGASEEELALVGDAIEPSPVAPLIEYGVRAETAPAPSSSSSSGRKSPPERPKAVRAVFRPALWMLWWVPTIVVPAVGGFLAWIANRRQRAATAQAMLIVGLLIGVLATIAFVANVEPLAAWYMHNLEKQVIQLPPSTSPGSSSASQGAAPGSEGGAKQ
jgi:hypothetical protein